MRPCHASHGDWKVGAAPNLIRPLPRAGVLVRQTERCGSGWGWRTSAGGRAARGRGSGCSWSSSPWRTWALWGCPTRGRARCCARCRPPSRRWAPRPGSSSPPPPPTPAPFSPTPNPKPQNPLCPGTLYALGTEQHTPMLPHLYLSTLNKASVHNDLCGWLSVWLNILSIRVGTTWAKYSDP